jgi:geranylgeranyl reductase family protein
MAGYFLARAGLDVLLIEKSRFPRRKICGGGLTHRAFQEMPFGVDPILHQSVLWGMIGFRGQKITTIKHNQPVAYLIDRASFDNFVLQKALDQGAKCLNGERVRHFHDERGLFTVQTDQNTWYSRYLVGADGVHSLIAKGAGLLPDRETSLAYEALLSYPQNKTDQLIQSITFDFGTLLSGYGWIFPKRDHLNVGVFRNWPGHRASKSHLLRFINQHPSLRELPILDLRAYPGPLGGRIGQLHRNRLILAGDAANLADPWLGEGLHYALLSGRMAAETIIQHSSGQINDLSAYSLGVKDIFEPQFMAARRLALLVSVLPYLNVHLIRTSATFQKMVIDLLRGERTHQQIWRDLMTFLPSKIMSLFWKNDR